MTNALLVLHIAVLGYWLGSELVINSEYRFICFRDDLPFAARDAMTDHLMNADQHVRYALILQLMLGSMLMVEIGMLPPAVFWIALVAGLAWLALVEIVHGKRKTAAQTIDHWTEAVVSVNDIPSATRLFRHYSGWRIVQKGKLTRGELDYWNLLETVSATF